jgi:Leucine-rich repeat (LRR) protein
VLHQGLESLKKLKILSIQSNRITKIEGLGELENLEQLYLSHNGVERLEGLEKNVSRNFFHNQQDLAFNLCLFVAQTHHSRCW